MLKGIGVDLVSFARIEELYSQFGEKFENRILVESEIMLLNEIKASSGSSAIDKFKVVGFLARRFAAKEAISKALGTGIGERISFKDIEVYSDKLGKPHVKILNKKLTLLQLSETSNIQLSISDEKSGEAIAFAVLEV
jgi:holo-[acyl-carrier protein] synthase